MSKPEDISDEIWERAKVYCREWSNGPSTILRTVARAIKAAKAEEREACAEHLIAIAKATPLGHESPQRGRSTYNWLAYCAHLIRKRGETNVSTARKSEIEVI